MKYKNVFAIILFTGLVLFVRPVTAQDYTVDPLLHPTFTASTGIFKLVKAAAVQADGKVLAGGNFTAVDGVVNSLIVRFNADGTRDATFNSALETQANDEVRFIKALPDGKMLVSGIFRINGAANYFVRLNSDGSVDNGFDRSNVGGVRAVEFLPDGKFMACGGFSSGAGLVDRFNPDGTLDPSFNAEFSFGGECFDLKVLPDGKMYAVGSFISVNGVRKDGIVKLNADGSTDTTFEHPVPQILFFNSRTFYKLALQPDGKLIANYRIDSQNSQGDPVVWLGMRRINPDGSIDGEFQNCGLDDNNTSILLQNDGRIITSGCRQTSNSTRYNFARVYPNGGLDLSLHRVVVDSNIISNIYRETERSYLIIGFFNTVDGLPRHRIARLMAVPQPARYDFDGDGKTDISVFRSSDGIWYTHLSSGNYQFSWWGLSTDKPVVADYDNDGKADVAVFRNGDWYIIRSSDSVFDFRTFGQAPDVPTTGDINGDGKADMIARHQAGAALEWNFRFFGAAAPSGTFALSNELPGDIPVTGDFNGDRKTEVGFYRDGHWYSRNEIASSTTLHFVFGAAGDIPVPGDYDGDERTDYAVFRPSTGVWYVAKSLDGQFIISQFGMNGDIPVPGDYDGDGKTDIGVYRNGLWFLQRSTLGFGGESWGLAGDIPIPAQSVNY